MTTRFTDLTEIAAVDVDDADVLALSDVSASASRKVTVASLKTTVGAVELSQVQVEDDTSTVFGSVSGERLGQSVAANLNATGTAPLYAARAWVNFNGTGTVAIRESGNVTSITDNGTGNYTVNFTTAMQDANYAVIATVTTSDDTTSGTARIVNVYARSTTSCSLSVQTVGNASADPAMVSVVIFR